MVAAANHCFVCVICALLIFGWTTVNMNRISSPSLCIIIGTCFTSIDLLAVRISLHTLNVRQNFRRCFFWFFFLANGKYRVVARTSCDGLVVCVNSAATFFPFPSFSLFVFALPTHDEFSTNYNRTFWLRNECVFCRSVGENRKNARAKKK